jgi:lipopolysaccharide export system permease protein
LGSKEAELQATLQWRLSIPLMVLVVTILAVPLSRTNNRQGRYGKLLPAIALYFTYLVALNGMRGALESGAIPIYVTLLPVHGVYLGIALLLLRSDAPKKSKKTVTDGEVTA